MRLITFVLLAAAHVPPGTWGGEGARLEVRKEGATLELDCGRGELQEPLVLERGRRISVKGTFTREAGPTRRDGAQPVVYTGEWRGRRLELTARADGTADPIGTWTLERGREVRLRKCR